MVGGKSGDGEYARDCTFSLLVDPLIPVVIPFSIDRNLLVKRIEMNNSTSG